MAQTTTTLTLEDFRKALAEEEQAAKTGTRPSESVRLDYAVAALNTMRGLDLGEKRMIVRRMAKILSR